MAVSSKEVCDRGTPSRRSALHAGHRVRARDRNGLHRVKALIALNDLRRAEYPLRLAISAAPWAWRLPRRHSSWIGSSGEGMVRREPDPADRRRVLITVTDQANAAGIATFGTTLAAISSLAAGYSAAEREIIHDFLTRLASLEEPDPTPFDPRDAPRTKPRSR